MVHPVNVGRAPAPDDPMAADLAALGLRIEAARSGVSPGRGRPVLLLDLENAYEELRVAGAEIRVQQEHIDQLLDERRTCQDRHELMIDVLPVPAVTTDAAGTIRGANAAAAVVLGRSVPHLVGKPLPGLFDLRDRSGVRDMLSALGRADALAPVHATTWSPPGAPRGRDLTISALPSPRPLAVWMLLERRPDGEALTVTRPRLARALTRLAELAATTEEPQEVLDLAATLCHDVLGPDVEVSISTGPPDRPAAVASTSPVAQRFDGTQLRLGEGPTFEAYRGGGTVTTDDARADHRFPRLALEPDAPAGVVSVPLEGAGQRVGVVTVLSTTAGPLDQLVSVVEILAATVGGVLHELVLRAELRATARDLERALQSRAVIDQAKGIVMADRNCDAEEAFVHLVRISREQEVKVRDVAQLLVHRRSGLR